MAPACKIQALKRSIASVYMGNGDAIDRMIVCLLARGHVLIEDVPGVGKTVLAQALARSVHCSFGRIQCTPDLLPSDITGVGMFDRETGHVTFRRGPVFASIVLADEINRATPRTQSALLEAMAEGTVSAEGEVHALPNPFMVIATQNPHEFEGTYLLPENQLDRFLMRIGLGYPAAEDESRIIYQQPARTALAAMQPVMDGDDVANLQREVDQVRIDQSLVDFIIAIAHATRHHPALQLGVSPRGALAIAQTARAKARCAERDFVIPEDILENITAVCAHRVVARDTGGVDRRANVAQILDELIARLPHPV
ncbi:MAG: AAA family ATPase [Phycisphaerales bacterium]|nr:AAA family ATPase [Phycisphaerales bacterium]